MLRLLSKPSASALPWLICARKGKIICGAGSWWLHCFGNNLSHFPAQPRGLRLSLSPLLCCASNGGRRDSRTCRCGGPVRSLQPDLWPRRRGHNFSSDTQLVRSVECFYCPLFSSFFAATPYRTLLEWSLVLSRFSCKLRHRGRRAAA